MNLLLRVCAFWLCLVCAAQATAPAAAPPPAPPFLVRFDPNGIGRGVGSKTTSAYDPALPGYHVQAEIATLILTPRADKRGKANATDRFVLAIRTSPGSRPMLEHFALIAPRVTVTASLSPDVKTEEVAASGASSGTPPSAQVPEGTYLRMAVVGGEVRVTFLPKAMALLTHGGKAEWIDWYRG